MFAMVAIKATPILYLVWGWNANIKLLLLLSNHFDLNQKKDVFAIQIDHLLKPIRNHTWS